MFLDLEDYQRFLEKFKLYFKPYLDVMTYCLIPNHFHFMVIVNEVDDNTIEYIKLEDTRSARELLAGRSSLSEFLSDQLRRYLSSHSLYFNHKYKQNGPLLMKKAKRTAITSEVKLWDLLCYIHHNPIHHGLASTYEEWPFSSYKDYLNNGAETGIQKVLNWLGNGNPEKGISEFIQMHKTYKENFER